MAPSAGRPDVSPNPSWPNRLFNPPAPRGDALEPATKARRLSILHATVQAVTETSDWQMTTVYEHLEAFAGEILGGWSEGADGRKLPFQVVQTAGGPHAGTTTFSTLGLSKTALCGGRSGKAIRHELIMIVPSDAIPPNIVGILQQAGTEALASDHAYLRGEVLGPRGVLFEGYEPKALYACIPVYFPEDFAGLNSQESGEVVFVWLVPLLDEEVAFVQSNGWKAFEQKWMIENPDLVDYRRTV